MVRKKAIFYSNNCSWIISISIIFTLLLFPPSHYSQHSNLGSKNISLESGLSQSNVRCMIQDRNGFLWIGTQDGLNRYDGYSFVVFRKEKRDTNTLAGDLITCLLEDRKGFIWIGTLGGLTRYNPKENSFKSYYTDNKNSKALQGGSISSLIEMKDGTIWIGNYLGGLSKYNESTDDFTTYFNDSKDPGSLSENIITSLCEGDDGSLWIGTYSRGLNRLNKNSSKFLAFKHESQNNKTLISDAVTSLCLDKDGNLLVGTMNGFAVFDQKKNIFKNYQSNPSDIRSLGGNHIQFIYKDKSNEIWIGTVSGGFAHFDEESETFTNYKKENFPGLTDNNVYSILEDNNKILWMGTNTGGITKWNRNQKKFKSLTGDPNDNSKLSNESIRTIFKDSKQNLWVGTDYGLNKISEGRIKKYFFKSSDIHSLNSNKVWSVVEDRFGKIWIGTQNGLASYNPSMDNFTRYTADKNKLVDPPVLIIRDIYFDKDQIIWLATYGVGLVRFNPKTNEFKGYLGNKYGKRQMDIVVMQIHPETDGKLLLATAGGLTRFDPVTETCSSYFSGSESDITSGWKTIFSIYEEQKGIFWLGTLGDGLVRFNSVNKSIESYSEKEGLSNDVVYSIIPQSNNYLWLSTNKGLSKFDLIKKTFKNYDILDNLPSNEFNAGAAFGDNKNEFYFGSIGGLVYFYPDSIYENNKEPSIAVTQFSIYDKPISLNKTYHNGDIVRLLYNENYISFEFAALDFTEPSKNHYAYMLEGVDKDWIRSGDRRYASYTNLSAGNYKFRVKACNSDGAWNEKGISILIIVEPPFWLRWWFVVIVASVLISLFVFAYMKRINKLKKEKIAQQIFSKKLIEAQENERKRIANELHDGLGQNLLIISNLAQVSLHTSDKDLSQKQLTNISENAQESIEEVRRISHNLHPYQLDELGLSSALQSMLKKLSDTTSLKLSTYIENIDGYIKPDQYIHLFRVVQEGMNNIIKHANAQNVVVSISNLQNTIQVIIKDDGKGMVNYSDNKEIKISGFGLQKMKERIKVLNGNLSIESLPTRGTTIKITIPVEER